MFTLGLNAAKNMHNIKKKLQIENVQNLSSGLFFGKTLKKINYITKIDHFDHKKPTTIRRRNIQYLKIPASLICCISWNHLIVRDTSEPTVVSICKKIVHQLSFYKKFNFQQHSFEAFFDITDNVGSVELKENRFSHFSTL